MVPSPKFHVHVMGPGTPLTDVLLNTTGAPGHTVVESALKETVGAGYTVTVMELVLVSLPLVAVSVIV